jgi:replicative DNA helicase
MLDPNLEVNVLQRILAEGSIRRAESLGLKDFHFSDPLMQDAFNQIKKHSRRKATAGQTPSLGYMSKLCPEYPIDSPVPEERLAELIGDLLSSALNRELQETLEDASKIVKEFKQPSMALDYLAKKVREMAQESGLPTHIKVDLPLGLKTSLETYRTIKEGGGMLGPAWPWGPMNEALQGHRNGHLNIFYAPSKHGKTWTALYAMVHAFLHSNSRVLVITTEMPADEIHERITCILSKVCNRRFQKGALKLSEETRLIETVSYFRDEDYNALIDSDKDISESQHRSIRVVNGVGGGHQFVRDQIEEYEPDLVFIDGIYNIAEGDQNHAMVKKVVADIKTVALEYNIPITATAQTNRTGWIKLEDLDVDSYSDIGMSSGLIFYADAVIRIHKFCAGEVEGQRFFKQYLNVPALRRDFIDPFIINFAPGADFGLYATGITPKEAASWSENPEVDDEEEVGVEGRPPNFGGDGTSFLTKKG